MTARMLIVRRIRRRRVTPRDPATPADEPGGIVAAVSPAPRPRGPVVAARAAIGLTVLTAVTVLTACAAAPARPAPADDTAPATPPASAAVAGPAPGVVAVAPRPGAAAEPGYLTGDGVPAVVAHGPTGGHRIALTFDSNMTDAMLHRLDTGQVDSYANTAVVDELEARHVPATFFLSGKWVQRYPGLTRRVAADPAFELASHSYAHLGFTAHCYTLGSLPTAEMAADVEHSFDVLAPFGGHQTRYFRFPGGCYDAAALRAVAPAHATVVQYDDVGGDPFSEDAAAITARVLRQAHDGGIVVLHITKANAPKTADALPGVIDGLEARGYRLVTLSDLLTPPTVKAATRASSG
jgi:peptidoglycan/xylan/chitin deacetylase (PgdA/CDA1 family)